MSLPVSNMGEKTFEKTHMIFSAVTGRYLLSANRIAYLWPGLDTLEDIFQLK